MCDRTAVLLVLFEHETWAVILREEHRLKGSESMVLRKVSGPEKDRVTAEWRRVNKEELHDFLPRWVLLRWSCQDM